jgi:hypothetical protein
MICRELIEAATSKSRGASCPRGVGFPDFNGSAPRWGAAPGLLFAAGIGGCWVSMPEFAARGGRAQVAKNTSGVR